MCHLCLGASPVFSSAPALRSHLRYSHGINLDLAQAYNCPDCADENKKGAATERRSRAKYQSHLLECHLTRGDVMKPMRKRRSPLDSPRPEADAATEDADEVEEDEELRRKIFRRAVSNWRPGKAVAPLKNASGQDCFSIAVIHLLAQTKLRKVLESDEWCACPPIAECPHILIYKLLSDVSIFTCLKVY